MAHAAPPKGHSKGEALPWTVLDKKLLSCFPATGDPGPCTGCSRFRLLGHCSSSGRDLSPPRGAGAALVCGLQHPLEQVIPGTAQTTALGVPWEQGMPSGSPWPQWEWGMPSSHPQKALPRAQECKADVCSWHFSWT